MEKVSQKEAILNSIRTHGEITQLEALDKIGCMRLASRIADLKKEGHSIIMMMRKNNITGKHYAVYKLDKKMEAIDDKQ